MLASHCPLSTRRMRVSICRQVLERQSHLSTLSPHFTPGCNAPNCRRPLIRLTKPSQASIPCKPLSSGADPRGPAPALGPLGRPLCLGTVSLPAAPGGAAPRACSREQPLAPTPQAEHAGCDTRSCGSTHARHPAAPGPPRPHDPRVGAAPPAGSRSPAPHAVLAKPGPSRGTCLARGRGHRGSWAGARGNRGERWRLRAESTSEEAPEQCPRPQGDCEVSSEATDGACDCPPCAVTSQLPNHGSLVSHLTGVGCAPPV